MDPRPELGFSDKIWAILLEFGLLCLDLGHFAQIWAILLGFGLSSRILVRIGLKGDEALRMGQGGTDVHTDVRMDGWADRFFLCSTRLRPFQGRCPKREIGK